MHDLAAYESRMDAEQARADQVAMRAEVIRTELAKTLGQYEPGDLIADAMGNGQVTNDEVLAAYRAGPEAFHAFAAKLIDAEIATRAEVQAMKEIEREWSDA